MAEKSEKATPKKLRDARKKGQVARSQDFPSAFTFIVSIATTIFLSGYLFQILSSYMIFTFKSVSKDIDLQNRAASIIQQAILTIFDASFPILIVTLVSGVVVGFLIVGPLFSAEAVKPDLKRLNPVTNLRNLFKFKTIFELLKSILKITVAFILIYSVVYNSLEEIISTAALPVFGSALIFSDFLVKVIIRVGVFFLLVAIMDLVYQKRHFAKEMMMEKFEVKREFKDTEGDPYIKSRRKQVAQEIAYQEGPSSVKRARAIVTNPTHIAVALEYDEAKEPAPRVLTMGSGKIADLIIKYAIEYHVPIMRNIELARTLFEKGKIGDYIPEETYQVVAEILKWITAMEQSKEAPEIFKT